MNDYLTYVQNCSLSVSDPTSDPSLPPLSSPETLASQGLLMETISTLETFKRSFDDSRRKDQILRDHCLESVHGSSFHRLESDIARQAIRDYERSLSLIKYLQSENEQLR